MHWPSPGTLYSGTAMPSYICWKSLLMSSWGLRSSDLNASSFVTEVAWAITLAPISTVEAGMNHFLLTHLHGCHRSVKVQFIQFIKIWFIPLIQSPVIYTGLLAAGMEGILLPLTAANCLHCVWNTFPCSPSNWFQRSFFFIPDQDETIHFNPNLNCFFLSNLPKRNFLP